MNDLTELPDWVWDLLDALAAYEDEHSPLYRYTGDGDDGYERVNCIGAHLDALGAWPPREVRDAAAFRRHVLRTAPAHRHDRETAAEEADRA